MNSFSLQSCFCPFDVDVPPGRWYTGSAIARDPKHVPEDLMRLMQQTFTEEQLVVITTMGVFMIANNYFNDILK